MITHDAVLLREMTLFTRIHSFVQVTAARKIMRSFSGLCNVGILCNLHVSDRCFEFSTTNLSCRTRLMVHANVAGMLSTCSLASTPLPHRRQFRSRARRSLILARTQAVECAIS